MSNGSDKEPTSTQAVEDERSRRYFLTAAVAAGGALVVPATAADAANGGRRTQGQLALTELTQSMFSEQDGELLISNPQLSNFIDAALVQGVRDSEAGKSVTVSVTVSFTD